MRNYPSFFIQGAVLLKKLNSLFKGKVFHLELNQTKINAIDDTLR